jgi:hypothetical protein
VGHPQSDIPEIDLAGPGVFCQLAGDAVSQLTELHRLGAAHVHRHG